MTAEETNGGVGEGGMTSCSTECSSTTPHLGSNDTRRHDPGAENNDEGRNDDHRASSNDAGNDELLTSSSTVCFRFLDGTLIISNYISLVCTLLHSDVRYSK